MPVSKLGAKVVNRLDRWVVMQAPTGQRFCVVRVQRPGFPKNANSWDQESSRRSAERRRCGQIHRRVRPCIGSAPAGLVMLGGGTAVVRPRARGALPLGRLIFGIYSPHHPGSGDEAARFFWKGNGQARNDR